MPKPVKTNESTTPETERRQWKKLWHAVHEPDAPDQKVYAYVNDLMTAAEARQFEAGFQGLGYVLAELQEERNQLQEAIKIERIEAWKEKLRSACEATGAWFNKALKAASEAIAPEADSFPPLGAKGGFGPAGFASVVDDEIALHDKKFVVRITAERRERRVRVLIQIKDTKLEGEQVRLRWHPAGASDPRVLGRATDESTMVQAEFFLSRDEAQAAQAAGLNVEFLEL